MVIFKVQIMKVLIILAVVSEVFSSSERSLSEKEKEPARTSKGLYSNSKLVDNRNLFSPRMEYDEWTPLGRGDPLKNDPTYDYVPPVLERVHYWMEPSKRTPDPPVLNSGVLILGSSRTEPTYAMRATTPKYQVVQVKELQADSRLDTMSLLDPFLKLMDVSKFGINLNPSTNNYYKLGTTQNRIHPVNYQRPPHHQQYYNQRYQQQPQALQRPPYTMLMPPPPPPSPTSSSSSSVLTFATVTTTTEVTTTPGHTTTPGTTTAASATTPITKSNQETNITTIYPTTVIANTENLYKPVAIAMPEENETIRNDAENSDLKKIKPDNVPPLITPFTKETEKEHKEAGRTPVAVQQQKRPPSDHHKLTEPHKYRPLYDIQSPHVHDNNVKQSRPPMTPPPKGMKTVDRLPSSGKWGADNRATTSRPVTTTRVAETLTTDPMFKHYKQPSEPIKGPFYLIIQGHSKVKTYGASKNPINGLLTSNEIREDGEERKDRYGEFYDSDSQELKNRKRGKSLRWFQSEANRLPDDERRKKFEKGDVKSPAISELSAFADGSGNVENLEDAFGKTEGGSSKKRYLVNDMINETLPEEEVPPYRNRQLLSEEEVLPTVSVPTMITVSQSTTTADSFDIESFIALNDDYTPEDVVSLLLKEEGQGSGFGNFVVSIFGKSLKENNEHR